MQLNPARGRKHPRNRREEKTSNTTVYAAQPREGTETRSCAHHYQTAPIKVYAAQPREGTETAT